RFDDADKAQKAEQVKQALTKVQEALAAVSEDQAYIVCQLDVQGNAKALSNAIQHVKSLKSKAAYLISPDTKNGRVAHQCVVPKALVTKHGFKAIDWANAVKAVVGGKCGGKDEMAQGSGTEVTKVEEACQVADQWAKSTLA
ncbi:Alanine--tRNA ligase, partial [Dimargaris xerosporica]